MGSVGRKRFAAVAFEVLHKVVGHMVAEQLEVVAGFEVEP